jgi:glutamate/tyrosine decarboxylase-like PLP-dependent enzyme
VDGLGALAGVEVLSPASLNQGLVRFNRIGDTPEENDAFTDEIIEKINATGEAFFSGTTWRGRRAMRISVVNWHTSESDVDRAVAAARAALAQSHAGSSLHIEG